MSFDLWKLDLDSGGTKRWRMTATQGSSKGHLAATHKDTAQQTNLSPLKHTYWNFDQLSPSSPAHAVNSDIDSIKSINHKNICWPQRKVNTHHLHHTLTG